MFMSGNNSRRHQSGAALIVALVMLLVMTLIAITASRTSVLQERMAGNLRQDTVAFEGAEATLRIGENWIGDQVGGARPVAVTPTACGSPPCDLLALNTLDPFDDTNTWGTNDVRTAIDAMEKLVADPEFFIEQQQIVQDSLTIGTSTDTSARIYYRVTARSFGETNSAESMLRSVYAARF